MIGFGPKTHLIIGTEQNFPYIELGCIFIDQVYQNLTLKNEPYEPFMLISHEVSDCDQQGLQLIYRPVHQKILSS